MVNLVLAADNIPRVPTTTELFGSTFDASPFALTIYCAIIIMGIALLMSLVLLVKVRNDTSRIVLADAVFYPMLGIYLAWSYLHETQIAYEVVMFGGLLGLLTSVSLARIVTKGRR
ncbi:cation:proton antiporter [Corynebacterium choanae]|uniref:Putative monovalent cation/H+ antiporter subunit F n=1 Tax=Corynebacterium choanae TaxID=1862358 RepID=A0A3G6J943_9CORY|nr:cation:proton antiporter [Corynebacterium choanae]AZA14587.1 putative monovalent cation/H+ antiporter subunit F [Corynebacterium choanae]